MSVRASIAESDKDTHFGLGVIIDEAKVSEASKCRDTRRRVISVSVIMPVRLPSLPAIKTASPRLAASICVIVRTVLSDVDIYGFFGRSFDTGQSFCLRPTDEPFLLLLVWLVLVEGAKLGPLRTELISDWSSTQSIAASKIDRQPSAPPHP